MDSLSWQSYDGLLYNPDLQKGHKAQQDIKKKHWSLPWLASSFRTLGMHCIYSRVQCFIIKGEIKKQWRFSVDNLMFGVQLANVSIRCSNHLRRARGNEVWKWWQLIGIWHSAHAQCHTCIVVDHLHVPQHHFKDGENSRCGEVQGSMIPSWLSQAAKPWIFLWKAGTFYNKILSIL